MTETTSELLDCLVRLPEDRNRGIRRVGELMTEGGPAAIDEAIGIFCARLLPADSDKTLVELLLARGDVLTFLQRLYETDRLRFREVLIAAHVGEPRLHIRAAKRLAELLGSEIPDRADEILFLLDSVVQMSGMVNVAAELPLLIQAKDPRLRAKAALLSSTLPNGRHLLELYRQEPDPRVRVCILESLWLDDQPTARVAYEEARRDPQPRVRAYGLLGLYRLGDLRALPALAEMAVSPQTLTRAVARCAMELAHESRFDTFLVALHKEFGESPAKREPISPAARPGRRSLHLAVPRVQRLSGGFLRLQVSVLLDTDEHLDSTLRPLDLRAWVNGQPVFSYTVSRVVPARRLGIGMVLPMTLRAASETSPGIRGVLDQLTSMPAGELRSASFYRSGLFMRHLEQDHDGASGAHSDEAPQPLRLPVITQDAFRFVADIKEASKQENLAVEPGELALATLNRLKVMRPIGHIGVILNAAVSGTPNSTVTESLRLGCLESGFSLHVVEVGQVASEIHALWTELSLVSGGFQAQIASEDELPAVVHHWMLCFKELYYLEFEAPTSACQIRLQAVHPAGTGEATARIAAE